MKQSEEEKRIAAFRKASNDWRSEKHRLYCELTIAIQRRNKEIIMPLIQDIWAHEDAYDNDWKDATKDPV